MPISAAATTKIRNASAAPAALSRRCANVTRLRFTPFSMSSMHISITSMLRVSSTAVLPQVEDRERGDDGRDQQHRDQLEMQPVLVEEGDRERAQAERGLAAAGENGHRAPQRAD